MSCWAEELRWPILVQLPGILDPTGAAKGMKRGETTHSRLGWSGLGSLLEKPWHPGQLACLVYRTEQRGSAVEHSGPRGGVITYR